MKNQIGKIMIGFIVACNICASTSNVVAIDSGATQWVKSTEAGSNVSAFNNVANDGQGNLYAAGYVYGSGQFDFGNGVTVNVSLLLRLGYLEIPLHHYRLCL